MSSVQEGKIRVLGRRPRSSVKRNGSGYLDRHARQMLTVEDSQPSIYETYGVRSPPQVPKVRQKVSRGLSRSMSTVVPLNILPPRVTEYAY